MRAVVAKVTGAILVAVISTAGALVMNSHDVAAVSTPVVTLTTEASPTTAAPTSTSVAPTSTSTTAAPQKLDLRAAQQQLTDLGYWLGVVDGTDGVSTQQATLAFQKVEGLALTSKLDDQTVAALATASRPSPQKAEGDRVEIDKSRQVLFIVRGGKVLWTFNTSTGTEKTFFDGSRKGFAHTPTGTFTFFRQVDANDNGPLGALYRPKYFTNDGVAVHGAGSVPSKAASHGCARVTNTVMDFIWSADLIPMGSSVDVYGTTPGT